MKFILLILFTLSIIGCSKPYTKLSTEDLVTAEGFTAISVALYQKNEPVAVKEEDIKAVQQVVNDVVKVLPTLIKPEPVKVQPKIIVPEKSNQKTSEVITPKKYLRLLSAEAGCGSCIHQDMILIGSDWIILNGDEKANENKIPYHGIHERVKSLNDETNPLWVKYNASSVPHWDLIVDGKVVNTVEGVLDRSELRRFYLSK